MEGNSLSRETILTLIMDYLHSQKLFKALLALEDEADISLHSYSKEIKFFRNLIIEGQWEDAEIFLQPLKLKKNFNHNAVVFELRRQKFLEMVDNNESYMAYVKALKQLEGLCTKEEFNSLWYWLTISKLNDHPSYKNWTPQNGRFMAFENAKKHLCSVFSFIEEGKTQLDATLEELLDYSYGMLHKKKASQILQQEFGPQIYSVPNPNNYEYENKVPKKRGRGLNLKGNRNIDDVSASMMVLGSDPKDPIFRIDESTNAFHRRNSFENNNNLSSVLSTRKLGRELHDISRDQVISNKDNSIMTNQGSKSQQRFTHKRINFANLRPQGKIII